MFVQNIGQQTNVVFQHLVIFASKRDREKGLTNVRDIQVHPQSYSGI